MVDGGLLGWTVGLITTIGAGIGWTWSAWVSRADQREKRLQEQEKKITDRVNSLINELTQQLAITHAEVLRNGKHIDELRRLMANQHTAIHLLVAWVEGRDPAAPVLRQVERLLGEDWQRLPAITAEMQEMVAKINQATS